MVNGDEQEARVAIVTEESREPDHSGDAIPVHIVGDEKERPEGKASEGEFYLDQLRRLQAEFVNYKRRIEQERMDFAAQGRRQLLQALLPVLDDFDNLLACHGQGDGAMASGLRQVAEKLHRVLRDNGLERFGQVGECFDPELHEAVATEPCTPDLEGVLLGVWQPGYKADGRVLRAAKVEVGRARPEGEM